MSNEPEETPATDPAWSYPPPVQRQDVVTVGARDRGDRSRRLAISAAVAVVAGLGGAVVAFAATNATASPAATAVKASPSPSPKQAPVQCPKTNMPCRAFGGPFHRFGFAPGLPFSAGFPGEALGAVHGQIVVAKPGGGYQTVDIQRGKATAVSASSITVRSPDGFTATYAVASSTLVDAQRDGITSVKVGNQVSLLANVSGSKATATSIADITLVQQAGPRW